MSATIDLYSKIHVADREASLRWYEAFFGRPPDEVIGDEALWRIGANGYVVVDDSGTPGGSDVLLGVTGLDEILARLTEHGIRYEPVETYANGVRHVTLYDPDGNCLSFAAAPAELATSG